MEAINKDNFLPSSLAEIPAEARSKFQAIKLFLGYNHETLQIGPTPQDPMYDSRLDITLSILIVLADSGAPYFKNTLTDLTQVYELLTYPLPTEGSVPRNEPDSEPIFIIPGDLLHYIARNKTTKELVYLGFLDKPTQNLYLDTNILFSDN